MIATSEASAPSALFQNLRAVEQRVSAASHIGLFLDFDGTISKIVPRPEDAVLDPAIRIVIEALAARPDFSIAIVSGRSLDDVRDRTALSKVIYAGNHGLEIESDSVCFREPRAEALRRELRCLGHQLQLALSDTDGLEIENKGLTLSVHFRRVNEHFHDWIRSTTLRTVARSRSFVCREGKMVLEVRPQVNWHKGHAVRWILREVFPYSSLPIYIGDDVTDEDAFGLIPEGIAIRVGDCSQSRAQYLLPDIEAVGEFLHWMDHARPRTLMTYSQRAG